MARDVARSTAYDALRAVQGRDAYANLVLPGLLRERHLGERDAALATELVYGTLRGLGTYDVVLGECLDRPFDRLDPPILDVLRLGAHQALNTRIPAHAAVAATVDLAREKVGPGPAKLVNAVLRRVTTTDLEGWVERLAPADPIERLALRHAHPVWIARAFQDALGGDEAELAACLAANNERPAVTLVARPGRCTVDELVIAGARPTRWSPFGAVLSDGDPARIAAVRQQRAGVQDEGSQLVTLALAGAPVLPGPVGPGGAAPPDSTAEPGPAANRTRDAGWLDLCAGPGGKAALLAGLAAERSARLVAVEQHEHRARLVERALAGGAGNHRVIVADGRRPISDEEPFDRVLLDAPCSGLGALRRRPEARWRRQPADIAALRPLQVELLDAALAAARPGGVVGYVTCSPHLAETTTVVTDVLARRDDAEWIDARRHLPDMPALGDGPQVQLWPHRHGTDAMYIALLRRR